MELLQLSFHLLAGWALWSLGHNLGHRWWHDEMRRGRQTFYAHGEREHHRVYDRHGDLLYQSSQDPKELFISFPFPIVAVVALLLVALYGWLIGWGHLWPFGAGLYGSMMLDHKLQILFHKRDKLPNVLGWLQQMHLAHHATHNKNYFFVSGLLWDVLFRTAILRREEVERSIFRASTAGTGT